MVPIKQTHLNVTCNIGIIAAKQDCAALFQDVLIIFKKSSLKLYKANNAQAPLVFCILLHIIIALSQTLVLDCRTWNEANDLLHCQGFSLC